MGTLKPLRRVVPAITALLGFIGGAALMRRTPAAPAAVPNGTAPGRVQADGVARNDGSVWAVSGEAEAAETDSGPPGATTPEGAEAPTPPSAEATASGFETKEMDIGVVVRILAGWGATVIVAVGILFWMIHGFHRTDARDQPLLTPQQSAAIVPPGPKLQGDPYRDLHDLYDGQQAELMSYGWSDPAHEKAHIPIARAMVLVTGRSLEPTP